MHQLLVKKSYPVLICLFALMMPVILHAELLVPAQEVLIIHVAALNEGTLFAQANDDGSDYAENSLEDESFSELEGISDPLEPWNRFWFGVNDKFYFWVFKPVAQGYGAVVPTKARVGIRNMYHNFTMPVRFVNALLQGKPKIAGYEFGRFFINTSVGLGGYFDVASREPELRSYDEDLGQTLSVWGVGHCCYLVWPFLGPSSLRDTFGSVGDSFINPTGILSLWVDTLAAVAISGYDYLNAGSLRIGDYEDLKEAALDPYIAMRNAYFQRRKAEVDK